MIIIISGPSGVGKGTVVKELAKKFKAIEVGITYTTRKPRINETNNIDYHFVSENEFSKLIEKGKLVEHSVVHGNFYGIPKDQIEEGLHGKDVVFQIDVQGAKKIKNTYESALLIFLMPPDLNTLLSRLNGRGTESQAEKEKRLKRAQEEIQERVFYDFIVTNNNLERAVNEIIGIIEKEREKLNN
jgi:guanylate kinase